MLFKQFAEKHNLTSVAESEEGKAKVSLGYFKHTIKSNDKSVEVITLSKDFSLFLSEMLPEVRRDFVFALAREAAENDNVFHLIKEPNQNVLVTSTVSSGKQIIHVEKRG